MSRNGQKKFPKQEDINKSTEQVNNENNVQEKNTNSFIVDSVKNILGNIDLAVIITLVSGLSMLAIFCFKITYMNIIGVPFQLIISVIDIKSVDFIIAFLLLILLIIIILGVYYYIYKGTKKTKFKAFTFVILIPIAISIIFKLRIYIFVLIEVNFIVLIGSLILLIVFHRGRPKNIIYTILDKGSISHKTLVTAGEIILYTFVLCIYSSLMANIYATIPTSKLQVVDGENEMKINRVVIYNSNSELLTATYKLEEDNHSNIDKININITEPDSIKLIEKGNEPIKLEFITNAMFGKINN